MGRPGIQRVRRTPDLTDSLLRHTGLSVYDLSPHTQGSMGCSPSGTGLQTVLVSVWPLEWHVRHGRR